MNAMALMATSGDTIGRIDSPHLHAMGTATGPSARDYRAHAKSSLDELALFGGRPTFPEPLHVGRPNLGNRERLQQSINDILDRVWLTNNGPYSLEFERRVAEVANVRHCVAVCNGTTGLQIAARALGMKGEVILPALTFIATPHALAWQGITPVFADVDPQTCCLDPASVEHHITSQTTGILGVHLWGRPCDVATLSAIADRHGLRLLFDAAHAFGCTHRGRPIGSFGDAEVFSFHATKFVHAGEGGAIVTNDDQLAQECRLLRNFGFSDLDQVSCLGINGKMSEFHAAVGLSSLEQMEEITRTNVRNYQTYRQELKGIDGIRLVTFDTRSSNHQYIVVDVDDRRSGISRDLLVEALEAEGVLARRYFFPGCHRSSPYCETYDGSDAALPATDAILRRVLTLPTGTAIRPLDVQIICRLIRLVVGNSQRIRARIEKRAAKFTAAHRASLR